MGEGGCSAVKWLDDLSEEARKRVLELQQIRYDALYDAIVLDGPHDKAREIIAQCSAEIARIAEGAS